MQNIFNGVIWFVLPVLLVCSNDTFAYICGFFLGKKYISVPLINLSVSDHFWSELDIKMKISRKRAGRGSLAAAFWPWCGDLFSPRFWPSFQWCTVRCNLTSTGTCWVNVNHPRNEWFLFWYFWKFWRKNFNTIFLKIEQIEKNYFSIFKNDHLCVALCSCWLYYPIALASSGLTVWPRIYCGHSSIPVSHCHAR